MKKEMQASQQREYKETKPPKVCVATGEVIDNIWRRKIPGTRQGRSLLSVRCKELFDC